MNIIIPSLMPSYLRWLIAATMLTGAFALGIEGPEDDAPPPVLEGEPAAQAEAMPMKQQAAFIGLVSGPIPDLLSTHLGIRNGEGVLVRSVMPDGPAAAAGIRTDDIIVTIDGKAALSPVELGNIIRSHQPGDKIKVGVIQAGKGTELEVTLGERPEQFAQLGGENPAEMFRMQGVPEDMAERLRDMIEGNMMQFQFDGEGIKPGAGFPDLQRDMQQMREQMKQLREQQEDMLKNGPALQFNADSTVRLMDEKGSVELNTNNGETTLTVRDKDNKIEWEGPWNNDEDKAKAPEEIRQRAGNLNFENGGFKLQLGR